MNHELNGILLLDKPLGWSSYDTIRKLKSALWREGEKLPKIGHAGTLDPLATGLLTILIGKYTKRQDEFMKQDKTYEAELTLGSTSSTDDEEGEKAAVSDKIPSIVEVRSVLDSFVGEVIQRPPAFSAVKIGGQRAYKLARAGKEVKTKERQVTIHSIDSVEYGYPKLAFTVKVSSGTYIRSLARDIGEQLGTGAYLSALRRTRVGELKVEDAISPERLDRETVIAHLKTPG